MARRGSELDDTAWMADAACAGMDSELFFLGRGELQTEAKAVCAGCPVREECLEYALVHRERWGVWGGKSERERRRLRRARSLKGRAA